MGGWTRIVVSFPWLKLIRDKYRQNATNLSTDVDERNTKIASCHHRNYLSLAREGIFTSVRESVLLSFRTQDILTGLEVKKLEQKMNGRN